MPTPKPGPMDKPTGPTGILSSDRKMTHVGGKTEVAKGKGLSCSPGTKMGGMKSGRRVSSGGRY